MSEKDQIPISVFIESQKEPDYGNGYYENNYGDGYEKEENYRENYGEREERERSENGFMKEGETEEERLRQLALEISILPMKDKRKFIRVLFENLPDKEKQKLMETVFQVVDPESYAQINFKLESMFEKNQDLKPYLAARMIRHYAKISPKMLPFLTRLAQKAKDRIRKRKEREKERKGKEKGICLEDEE